MNKLTNSLFTILCLTFLCVYHFFGWKNDGLLNLDSLWTRTEITVHQGGHQPLVLPSWTSVENVGETRNVRFISFGRTWIGYFGNLLNYWTGTVPNSLVLGSTEPVHWYFNSWEPGVQGKWFAHYVDEVYGTEQRKFIGEFRKHGITCVFVPITPKSAIERDHIPPSWKSLFDPNLVYGKIVRADPDWTVDLYSSFSAFKKMHPEQALYRPFDHHWTSLGATLAVRETLKLLVRNGWKEGVPELRYLKEYPANDPSIGRALLNQLFLPASFVKTRPELRWAEPIYDIAPPSPQQSHKRMIVFGSSFSRDPHGLDFTYAGTLARAVGRELLDFSVAGGDFVDGLKNARDAKVFLRKGDLVILEFPTDVVGRWKDPMVLPEFEI
jgi:hypothetical protein